MAYPHPPITEAVIEFRFEPQLPMDRITSVAERVRVRYPQKTAQRTFQFTVDNSGGVPIAKHSEELDGLRLASDDQSNILIVASSSVITARLAPYEGWERFSETAKQNWAAWLKIAGARKVIRIGIRYVNRIDVPSTSGDEFRIDDYLNVTVSYPPIFGGPLAGFLYQASGPSRHPNWNINLATTPVVPSPLFNHVSLLLDIDLYRTEGIPQSTKELWEVIHEARMLKNDFFESLITDTARDLFSK